MAHSRQRVRSRFACSTGRPTARKAAITESRLTAVSQQLQCDIRIADLNHRHHVARYETLTAIALAEVKPVGVLVTIDLFHAGNIVIYCMH